MLPVSSGTATDKIIKEYIKEQDGEQIIDASRFPIGSP
jgi:REP-associated tyrosine transposase